jgi:hypothetical protein
MDDRLQLAAECLRWRCPNSRRVKPRASRFWDMPLQRDKNCLSFCPFLGRQFGTVFGVTDQEEIRECCHEGNHTCS